MTEITYNRQKDERNPVLDLSPLGEKLREIRQKILDSGIPLLSDEEIDRELNEIEQETARRLEIIPDIIARFPNHANLN